MSVAHHSLTNHNTMSWGTAAWEAFDTVAGFAANVEAAAEAAEVAYDQANNFAHAFTNEVTGDLSSHKRLRSGVKRKFTGDPVDPPEREHRRIEPIPPQPNMPAPTYKGQSSGKHQDEVAVMPHHGPLNKIIEDYHTITLSYHDRIRKANGAPGQNNFNNRQFRLNSIYDVDETEGLLQVPMGRDLWASIYKYYRVLSTHVNIKIINFTQTNTMYAGFVPEEDTVTLTENVSNFMMRKNAIRTIIPGYLHGAGRGTGELNYSYNPNTWDHHVQETGVEERWTPIGESPANNHRLIFRLIGADGSNIGPNDTNFELHIQIKYVVQFREANKTILTTGNLAPPT